MILDFPIERLNSFLDKHIFEVFGLDEDKDSIPLNIKVQITGIKEYISMGNNVPFVEYTLYILPHEKYSNVYYQVLRKNFGRETDIDTRSDKYQDIRWVMNEKLSQMLKYFSINFPTICTKVINELEPFKLNESLIIESKFNPIVRQLVRDVISIFKSNKKGEFGLPEDLYHDKMVYNFPHLDTEFSIFLDLQQDPQIDGFDLEADFFRDDDLIYLTIISSPNSDNSILQELTGELNETLRHELEHIQQMEQGYKFPKDPKDPFKYYTQKHELDAQVAGFKRRAKQEKVDFETIVRNWFKKYPYKHRLNPEKQEKVIQKILELK